MKFGIVGTGKTVSIADCHTRGLIADSRAEISAVYNRYRETSEAWISRHKIDALVCESYEDLLANCDAVIICTPNSSHFEYSLKAINAGRHVLCEKPMSLGSEQANVLAKAAENTCTISQVGFIYRFSPGVNALKKLVEEKLGQIYFVTARMGGSRLANKNVGMEWRMYRELSGSGAFGDFGSHLLDIAAYACNLHFEKVEAMTSTVIKERKTPKGTALVENDDVASFVCMVGSTVGSFTVSRVGMDGTCFLVAGEGGIARLEMSSSTTLTYFPKDLQGGYTDEQIKIDVEQDNLFVDGFASQISDFINAIEGKPHIGASFTDGAYVEQILGVS